MKIKPSMILSILLAGSVLFTGCGSSSTDTVASTNTGTDIVDDVNKTDTEITNPIAQHEFTTAMLSGKTFYTSYLENNTTFVDNTQLNFSADASTVEMISMQVGSDNGTNYGTFPQQKYFI